MRVLKNIMAACALGAVFVGTILWFGKVRFLTQEVKNLQRVTIILDPDYPETEKAISISGDEEIEKVYQILRETTKLSINKHPRHAESVQWDSKFAVILEYRDGGKDEFRSTEKHGGVFRFLDTRGGSGDSGYISGSNEKLWDYVLGFKENKTGGLV